MRIVRLCAALAALAFVNQPARAGEPAKFRVEIGAESARILAGSLLLAHRRLPPPRVEPAAGYCHVWRGGGRHGVVVCEPGPYSLDGRYGYRPRPAAARASRTFSGDDLALIDLGIGGFAAPRREVLPAPKAADPAMDQWRLALNKDGTLDANPAPLVSTAELLRNVALPRQAAAPLAADAPPVVIRIEGGSREAAIAANQRLLGRLGYYAGAADGLLGPATRDAIARFEVGMGLEPTGRLTARMSTLIHRAAGVKETPAGGKITVEKADGVPIESSAIDFAEPLASGQTHVLVLTAGDGPNGERRWQLLTLAGAGAAAAETVFGVAASRQAEAALDAVRRVRMPDDLKARLGELAGPGTILVIGGAPRA